MHNNLNIYNLTVIKKLQFFEEIKPETYMTFLITQTFNNCILNTKKNY